MPKRRETRPAPPAPVQLPLFADAASLVRIRPEHNEWRFYRMEIWPDLFGGALLVRRWGRIGTEGRCRFKAPVGVFVPATPIDAPHSWADRIRPANYESVCLKNSNVRSQASFAAAAS